MNANPLFGQRHARDRYDLLVADVTRAISDADPKSLLEFEAPSDEYSPVEVNNDEAQHIARV
jgi:hypothetical protein